MPLSLPCHGDWDFRIHPGTFDLYLGPVLDALRRFVSGRREYYARNRKRPDGYRSHIDHIAAVDWLEDAANRANLIVWDGEPDLIWHRRRSWSTLISGRGRDVRRAAPSTYRARAGWLSGCMGRD